MSCVTTNRPRPLFCAALMAAALVGSLGCDYRSLSVVGEGPATGGTSLGAVCSQGAVDASPTSVAIDTESAACSSRICLRPAQEKMTDTAALCTQRCGEDADCAGGNARDPQDPTDQRCQTGFTCRAIIPNLASVSLACQKLCVCKDFLADVQDTSAPAGCP